MLYRHGSTLEHQVLIALRRAMADGRLDVADHLLCALEVYAAGAVPGSALTEAYLSVAASSAPSTTLDAPRADGLSARPRRSSASAVAHPISGGRRRSR